MTRRVSRHGTAYTQGSQGGFGLFPHDCAGCDQRIVLSRDTGGHWFECVRGELRSWHFACRPRRETAASASVAAEAFQTIKEGA